MHYFATAACCHNGWKLSKMSHLNFLIVSYWKCNRSSLRSQCWMRLFLWFSNTVSRHLSNGQKHFSCWKQYPFSCIHTCFSVLSRFLPLCYLPAGLPRERNSSAYWVTQEQATFSELRRSCHHTLHLDARLGYPCHSRRIDSLQKSQYPYKNAHLWWTQANGNVGSTAF